ncbi:MAG: low molecular weight phosphotyrosine protein phosphatase [Eubacterium sp.]|nr:low molecular weight phosphotyrosine protein phosphatase [Eubacterium sp.]
MIKILFICHGNICRSTMAQFVMEYMVEQKGLSEHFYIDSAATSTEEIGNGPHHGTVRKMREMGIPMRAHRAVQLRRDDYEKYDYLIGMDRWNEKNILRIIGSDPQGKVSSLLDYTPRKGQEIADPWYTGNFDETYRDVDEGCRGLLDYLLTHELSDLQ